MSQHNIALMTKGHPYEREPFCAMFDTMPGVDWCLVEQPAAQALFDPEHARQFDAFVLYDMPGIRFRDGAPPEFETPSASLKQNLQALLEQGHGFVFLHHAIAGWPAWPEYADLIGGRFNYLPATLRGCATQDSGYRHGVTHTVRVVDNHPVTQGLPAEFQITDELYLYEVFEDDIHPLLISEHEFVSENFYSAAKVVVEGKMYDNEGWHHDPGSNLIGWTRTPGNNRIVYLQCGDDPAAYANPHFRQLIANAIAWVSDRPR